MKSLFIDLFEYCHHSNRELATYLLAREDKVSERAVKLYNHILNAHHLWNNRISPGQAPVGVWEIHPGEKWHELDRLNFETSIKILESKDFEYGVKYVNTKGIAYTNNVREILFHVINHSTYHRAQIAADLKQSGMEPLVSDYIVYKR